MEAITPESTEAENSSLPLKLISVSSNLPVSCGITNAEQDRLKNNIVTYLTIKQVPDYLNEIRIRFLQPSKKDNLYGRPHQRMSGVQEKKYYPRDKAEPVCRVRQQAWRNKQNYL